MKDIQSGILLEDSGSMLKWGKSLKSITKKTPCLIKDQGDRTIYFWDKHTILNGLELNLQTMFWNFGKDRWFRKFNKVEHWVVGDKEAQTEYERISNHLTNELGPPDLEKITSEDKSMVWKKENVELSLYLFEQHCYKLHFTICRK